MLDRNTLFVKEHVGVLKLTDRYDILDPETQAVLGVAQEEPAAWAKYLRMVVNKKLMPTVINIYLTGEQTPLFSIHRGVALLRAKVDVRDRDGQSCGYFKSKVFSMGGAFSIYDASDKLIAKVKGDWKGWNFKMLAEDGAELGQVTKKWSGLGKELFTSADNYIISIAEAFSGHEGLKMMLVAAGLAIDMVYKENK